MRFKKFCLHPLTIIVVVALLLHWLVFLNRGVYWDGWLTYRYFLDHNTALLKYIYFAQGNPIFYYVQRVYWALGFGQVINISAWLAIVIAASATYGALRLYRNIPKSLALVAAVLVIAFPGSLLTFFRAINTYYFAYACFFVAAYLGLRSVMLTGYKAVLLRCVSLLIFIFLSFNLRSLVSYYFVFLLGLYILYSQRHDKNCWSVRHFFAFIAKHLDYCVIPFAYLAFTFIFLKPYGPYVGYNSWHPTTVLHFPYLFLKTIKYSVWLRAKLPIIAILVAIAFVICYRYCAKWRGVSKTVSPSVKAGWALIVVGCIAFFLGVVPYILVGKAPDTNFIYQTRCAILVPSAMGLIGAGLYGLFFVDAHAKLTWLGKIVAVISLCWFFIYWNTTYLKFIAESALQKSFIQIMKTRPQWGQYSLYWVTSDFNQGLAPIYADYSWGAILNSIYGGYSRYGYSDQSKAPANYEKLKSTFSPATKTYYYIKDFNVNGCQATMVLQLGKYGRSYWPIAGRYLYYRVFKPARLSDFYQGLMRISVSPYDSWAATDCQSTAQR